MQTIPYPQNLWSFALKTLAGQAPINAPIATAPAPSVSTTEKLRISVQDLECISDALLHYMKIVRQQGNTEALERLKSLDKKIFDHLTSYTPSL
ncbi:hypothetical protein [Eisenibacter elegans]|jgi:hypothetical protein|uniref:hypothetical protein n=1 Tax=Eisenibacter elegans TaxID=997 RepID=UPI00040DCA63|nr:hypothetical protein [Eisenibacter elegans]